MKHAIWRAAGSYDLMRRPLMFDLASVAWKNADFYLFALFLSCWIYNPHRSRRQTARSPNQASLRPGLGQEMELKDEVEMEDGRWVR